MIPKQPSLVDQAQAIWHAGVDAVRSDRLVLDAVRVDGGQLRIADLALPLDRLNSIAVVGCGKAGAGMADGLERALGDEVLESKRVVGWLNVPDDCVRPLRRIQLHGARPAGINEPTEQGVIGARRILEIVGRLGPDDLCLCLISGGGSALLPAPPEPITLEDKLAVTRQLSAAGANIRQLNTVRKQLSRIKGGGLARACPAGRLISLIISDVLGDPLDVIASGPTVPDASTPRDALDVLDTFRTREAGISARVFAYLEERAAADGQREDHRSARGGPCQPSPAGAGPEAAGGPVCEIANRIIGNNATAVAAAVAEARRRGFETTGQAMTELEGEAEAVGRQLAERGLAWYGQPGAHGYVSGGEPTVKLVDASRRGKGGRNQQLVLAALERLIAEGPQAARGLALLSGGTDGEDGPTDAAGAWLDERLVAEATESARALEDCLRRNDAYHYFLPRGALLRTGPTHTNVCDLRILLRAGAADS